MKIEIKDPPEEIVKTEIKGLPEEIVETDSQEEKKGTIDFPEEIMKIEIKGIQEGFMKTGPQEEKKSKIDLPGETVRIGRPDMKIVKIGQDVTIAPEDKTKDLKENGPRLELLSLEMRSSTLLPR